MKGLPAAIAREAAIVIGGAIVAALVVGMFPDLKAWIKAQWTAT